MTDDKPRYLAVSCRIVQVSRDAVCIDPCKGHPDQHWIPLSLIHGADELALRGAMRGDLMTLRIMDWKVRQLGLPIS
jgi:hypothetical protein